MVKLRDIIDKVEVGMLIGLYNGEKCSYLSGIVKKKLLIHDSNTHEEYHHLEIDVDDFIKEITDIEKYEAFTLMDRDGNDLIRINLDDMRDFYFPDAYTDPVQVFCEMVETWNYCDEDEKDAMVAVLMERMNRKVMQEIIEKMSRKRNALAVTLGLEDADVFDQDEDVEDEE